MILKDDEILKKKISNCHMWKWTCWNITCFSAREKKN